MASSPASALTSLQRAVLRAFFTRERAFYLTGGGALVGFHLAHRTTDDLDLCDRADGPAAARPEQDGVRIERPETILANKLTTIVRRAEERDLIDVLFLERAGYRVEDALPAALAKDGGRTPATLAWLLSEVEIPDGVTLPGGVDAASLRAFVADLIVRLRRAAMPADRE